MVILALFLVATAAAAQSYPNRPVKIVVSYPAGGPVDVLARPLAAGLQQEWGGSPVLVENRPGANAIIGTDYVAKQPGDGNTLLFANDPSLSSNQYLYSKLPYDPVKDLVPVLMAPGERAGDQPARTHRARQTKARRALVRKLRPRQRDAPRHRVVRHCGRHQVAACPVQGDR